MALGSWAVLRRTIRCRRSPEPNGFSDQSENKLCACVCVTRTLLVVHVFQMVPIYFLHTYLYICKLRIRAKVQCRLSFSVLSLKELSLGFQFVCEVLGLEEKSEERRDSGDRVTSNTRIPASETRGWRGGRFPCQPWREGHRRVPRWGRRSRSGLPGPSLLSPSG